MVAYIDLNPVQAGLIDTWFEGRRFWFRGRSRTSREKGARPISKEWKHLDNLRQLKE
jgi:hypothetical protein